MSVSKERTYLVITNGRNGTRIPPIDYGSIWLRSYFTYTPAGPDLSDLAVCTHVLVGYELEHTGTRTDAL